MPGLSLWELVLIAVGLSMDAFAVSVCKGLSLRRVRLGQMVLVGAYFGGFQMGMPLLGYLLGAAFASQIARVDHWIAFVLLTLIGGSMLREASSEETALDSALTPRVMLPLAVATSIDALAAGVSFAALGVRIVPASALIGAITFGFSAVGLRVGQRFGSRWHARAERLGGMLLMLMGLRILLTHLLGA